MIRLSDELLSSVIGDIYDCALSPDGWTAVLTRITQALDAAYTTISLTSSVENRGRFAAQSPWDPEQMQVLQERYSLDQIPGLKEAVYGDIDTPVTTLSVMSEAELHGSAFYREWAKPQGLREACTAKFVHTPDRIGLLNCTTWANRDVLSAEGQRFLGLLSPHLRRASMIGDLLDQTRIEASFYRGTLDTLSVPVILTDAKGTILFANRGSEALLSEGTLIASRNGRLTVHAPMADHALKDAIGRAAGTEGLLGGRGIGLPISTAGQLPAVAYVLPLSEGTARAAFRPAAAAIFISTTTAASPPPEAVLITLFELTPAEARVLVRIGSGMTPAQCAALLDISENTLKTHLSRIYGKTGTTRQADLVRLMADIGAPLTA